MGIKKYSPTSPGRRGMSVSDFSEITRSKPEKKLTSAKSRSGGRNNYGRITTRHRGGGAKRRYRIIDFKRDKLEVPAKVFSIEYDPNRSSRIALLHYADGEKRYILHPVGLKVGDTVLSSEKADILPGNTLPIKKIPLGTAVHNLELRPGKGGQIIRSAGTSGQIMAKDGRYSQIRLPSGEVRKVLEVCHASIGQISNVEHENIKIGKAGRKRHLGIRPTVRGVVMNPVDHPHGGGEGRSGQGNPHPVSPWGWQTKGMKTRHNKSTNKYIVRKRSKK